MNSETENLEAFLRTKVRLLVISFALILGILIWAIFAKIEVVVTAQGSVVPTSAVKTLQNLEGGILKNLYVRPGDLVYVNQPVAQIESLQYESELRALQAQLLGLYLRRERIEAELNGHLFAPSREDYQEILELVEGELKEFQSRRKRIDGMRDAIALAETELAMISELANKSLEPRAEVIRASLALEERRSVLNQAHELLASELNKIQTELQTKEEVIEALTNKVDRATIKSPVNGIVGELFIKTEGSIVAPGAPIIEVIPTEERLIVEGRIASSDVAKIQAGMSAVIKLTAYDFSIYGSVPGLVSYISPDVSKDSAAGTGIPGQNSFVVRVEAIAPNKNIELRSGLDATIDIVTGQRTIAEYLLSPLKRSMDNVLKGG